MESLEHSEASAAVDTVDGEETDLLIIRGHMLTFPKDHTAADQTMSGTEHPEANDSQHEGASDGSGGTDVEGRRVRHFGGGHNDNRS